MKGNHPNRPRKPSSTATVSAARDAASNPRPAEITKLRESKGLNVSQAAMLVHTSYRAWLQWENGERRMHPAFFELFQIKMSNLLKYMPPVAATAVRPGA